MLNKVEATEVIDGLCERLQETEFEGYEDETELLLDVGALITQYVSALFGDLASVWVEGRDRGKIKSVWAYGTDFSPDIAIEMGELPVVAMEVRLAKRDNDAAELVAAAIGQALVCSVQYPYVIIFILDRSESKLHKHWFDSEIETRLWEDHRISLIVSQ